MNKSIYYYKYRSSRTGRFVSKKYAERHKATTQRERFKR